MEPQLLELIEYLVRQQFYKPQDIIMDRMKEQRIHIKTSGRAIIKFVELLTKDLSDILDKNYKSYLEKFRVHLSFKPEELYQAFSDRLSRIDEVDKTPHIIVTFFMGELIGKIRDQVFKQYLQEVKNRLKTQFGKIEDHKKFEQEFKALTESSFERNDPNIALIYNLSFLEFIAGTVHAQKLKRTTKILLGKYMNQLVKTLSQA